jgi:hypothetical protein
MHEALLLNRASLKIEEALTAIDCIVMVKPFDFLRYLSRFIRWILVVRESLSISTPFMHEALELFNTVIHHAYTSCKFAACHSIWAQFVHFTKTAEGSELKNGQEAITLQVATNADLVIGHSLFELASW